ncbi:sensor histidine kinase [Zhenhengia yiwuensis]|uniref:sensor histidine kinase n=1 Tax=Zhenhengia yiwuensis TaxID=2763666 RepID=UPI002A76415F|nr:histidine kinase [Zhenhengia yiwuensis]MDY3368224.1 histidine kinase [Zhenhengia yiwuensis]
MRFKSINMTKVLLHYRYVSLVVASIFYVWGIEHQNLEQMMMVIGGMFFNAILMHYLYLQSKGSKREIIILVLLETIGNCILLIPSGGVHSPYIWYILNTIMIAGIDLGPYYLWGNVIIYLMGMIGTMHLEDVSCIKLMGGNLIVGFVLIAAMIQILIRYLKEIEEKGELAQYYLDYTLGLYEAVYLFSTQEDQSNLIHAMMNYIKETRDIEQVLFLECQGEEVIVYADDMDEDISQFKTLQEVDDKEVYDYKEGYIGIPVRYMYKHFGMLVVKGESNLEELKFIAYVGGMILEKLELESINQDLVVSNEQNRIANEIHDSVIQQLFGVSCQLFTLTKRVDKISQDKLIKELKEIRETVTGSMGELRATIYGMSWNKQGKNDFLEKLQTYIETMKNLHHILITLEIEGDVQRLNIEEQKALYRVCCEGIANGIRHGKAEQILVSFKIESESINLYIQDNGIGFDYEQVKACNQLGLGIKNMEQLVYQIDGYMHVHSEHGEGTLLDIQIGKGRQKERVSRDGVVAV